MRRQGAIKADELEEFVDGELLTRVGALPEVIREWDAGEDHSGEVQQARDRLAKLEADYAAGKYDSPAKE